VFGSASQAVRITREELWVTPILRKAILRPEFEATDTLHLTSANSFESSKIIQIFDADGNLLFTACERRTGTRFE
jgi:hypothetical protein